MNIPAATRYLILGTLLVLSATAGAQDAVEPEAAVPSDTAEMAETPSSAYVQADVWQTVEGAWNLAAKGSSRWIDQYLSDQFVGWSKNVPVPRNKTSIRMWDRFENDQGKVVMHELYPLSIVVHGETAVAHYLYTSAYEDRDGDVTVSNGRYTDVLVLEGDDWKFIAWHGGDDE